MTAFSYNFRRLCCALSAMLLLASGALAEDQQGTAPAPPFHLTLQDALDRAKKNSTVFQSAVTEAAISKEDKNQARDALLPGVVLPELSVFGGWVALPLSLLT